MTTETEVFSVLNFNASDGFGDKRRNRIGVLLVEQMRKYRNIRYMNFPEAYRPGSVDEELVSTVLDAYADQTAYSVPYDTADGRKDDHVLVTTHHKSLAENAEVSVTPVRFETRNGVRIRARNRRSGLKTAFFGTHLDDREEASRIIQARSLIGMIEPDENTIIAGDLNAPRRESAAAQVARLLGWVGDQAQLRPASLDPNPETAKRSLFQKIFVVADAAVGTTMDIFDEAAFFDADRRSLFPASTVKPRVKLAIDHILCQAGVEVVDFGTFEGDSDHRGSVATVKVVRQVTALSV